MYIVACGVPEISTYVNTKIAKITNLVNLDEADNVKSTKINEKIKNYQNMYKIRTYLPNM